MADQPNQPTIIDSSSSSVNTILIVAVLVVLVGFGVWWYKTYASAPAQTTDQNGLQINVDTGGSAGQTAPAGSPTPSSPQNY